MRLRTPSRPSRPVRRALLGTTATALALLGAVLWFGFPYPAVDPDAVAARLEAEVRRTYDEAGLPPGSAPERGPIGTSSCYYRGLRYLAHFDRPRPDVSGFTLSWRTEGVSEAVARTGLERTRARLTAAGWKSGWEDGHDPGAQFEHPDSGDKVTVDWYGTSGATGTYEVSVYAACGKLPDGFDPDDRSPAASPPAL